jgi:AcrR family transcriptional regulator
MGKGKLTREMILSRAADLFNSRGYFGASIADIMEATGLEKGGIYNHFESKDLLAVQAFEHACSVTGKFIVSQLEAESTAVEKLLKLVALTTSMAEDPPVAGGCPILNSAIECDDAHPLLRERVRHAMDRYRRLVESVVESGIAHGELEASINPHDVAITLITTLEGALMMSKLYHDSKYLAPVSEHLSHYIKSLTAKKKRGY